MQILLQCKLDEMCSLNWTLGRIWPPPRISRTLAAEVGSLGIKTLPDVTVWLSQRILYCI